MRPVMNGTEMSVPPVTMVDYFSEEAADEFEAVYPETCPKCFQKPMN